MDTEGEKRILLDEMPRALGSPEMPTACAGTPLAVSTIKEKSAKGKKK